MHASLIALGLCVVGAVLEGVLAGSSVKTRFSELRLPPASPSLRVWIGIGVAYYAICFFVCRRLLLVGLATGASRLALALLVVLMLSNAAWGVLFFRRRNLRWSFLAFFPYGLVAALLAALLLRVDRLAALAFLPYVMYLVYATWWGHRLWRLNESTPAARSCISSDTKL